jgi:hypothetical protein
MNNFDRVLFSVLLLRRWQHFRELNVARLRIIFSE